MILDDLILLLKTADRVEDIDLRKDEIKELIPKVGRMFDYDQMNSTHQFDLWMHSLHTVVNLPRNSEDDMLYLAALLHDIGKPDCQCRGPKEEDTNMHYYGHPKRSAEIVKKNVIPDLEKKEIYLSFEDKKRLLYYIEWHDDHVSYRLKHLRRHLKIVGFEEFRNLMQLQVADARAHVQIPIVVERIEICSELAGDKGKELYKRILDGE